MSHIPNSAMPHAGPTSETGNEQEDGSAFSGLAGNIAEKVRENPKTAIAAGAVLAGAVAAAAIPLVGRRGKESGSGTSKKSSSKKS